MAQLAGDGGYELRDGDAAAAKQLLQRPMYV